MKIFQVNLHRYSRGVCTNHQRERANHNHRPSAASSGHRAARSYSTYSTTTNRHRSHRFSRLSIISPYKTEARRLSTIGSHPIDHRQRANSQPVAKVANFRSLQPPRVVARVNHSAF